MKYNKEQLKKKIAELFVQAINDSEWDSTLQRFDSKVRPDVQVAMVTSLTYGFLAGLQTILPEASDEASETRGKE
jgi:hypothetical protein